MADAGRFPASRDAAFAASDALMAEMLAQRHALAGRPILAGLCGAQGSGKSTTALRLAARLEADGLAAAILSIDDFYMTRAERGALGRDVHPLLETRGVPGTHDIGLACRTLDALLAGRPTALPRFDKTIDDRAPRSAWPLAAPTVAVVILEGWCVAARPMPEAALGTPINALEREEDPGGVWRRHVNRSLGGPYAALFSRLDRRILLRAPDFSHVQGWRLEQEQRLVRDAEGMLPAMDAAGIARFIAHYERLTRWIMEDEPADLVIEIGPDRTPLAWRARP